jgi:hypothetical protein
MARWKTACSLPAANNSLKEELYLICGGPFHVSVGITSSKIEQQAASCCSVSRNGILRCRKPRRKRKMEKKNERCIVS